MGKKDFEVPVPEHGYTSGIQLYRFDEDMKRLKNPQEVITKRKNLTLAIDYPLSGTHFFKVTRKKWTRAELARVVYSTYKKIYEVDDKDRSIYGVWGHDMHDLCIVNFYISEKGVVRFGVDS